MSHRLSSAGVFILLLLFTTLPFPFPARSETAAPANPRERAVLMAREGRIPEAVSLLESLRAAHPGDPKTLGDLLVVLQWGGQDRRVLDLSKGLDLAAAPPYVGEAVARAARNLGDYDSALTLYRSLRARFPENWESALGLALTLSEAGAPDAALALARELDAAHPQNPQILLGAAYIHRRRGECFEALGYSEKALALEPNNAAARRLTTFCTADLGAPFLALKEANRYPDLFTEDELRRLRGDRDAEAVKWGRNPPLAAADRFAGTDRALAWLRQDMSRAPAEGPAYRRARLDRVAALRDRFRMEEVVAEFESLRDEGTPLPPYLLRNAADAYLHLRRPEEAARLYRAALEGMPGDFDTRMSLFYAEIEAENFEQAYAQIDALAAEETQWGPDAGRGSASPNWKKEAADSAAALGRAYGGLLPEAQAALEPMVAAGPANGELRQKLATVYRWRGWLEKAETEYGIALAHAPDSRDARIGLAWTYLENRDYARAQPPVESLRREFPEDSQVTRLAEEWDRLEKWELNLSAGTSWGSGGTISDREYAIESRLYAPLFAQHYRPFVHGFWLEGKIPEGTASYRRAGAGLDFQSRRWSLAGEVNAEITGAADPGVSLEGAWHPGDHWRTGGRLDSFSTEVPLRARSYGIDGRSARFSLAYIWHERRSARLEAGVLDMSDGNVRTSGTLALEQRLLTRPRFRLTGTGELYASANSRKDAPYFNPEQDFSAALTGVGEWILYRRFEYSFLHRLLLGSGLYQQQGFGTAPLFTAGYEQQWQPGGDFTLRYGVTWTSRVYDGDREGRTRLHLDLDWRF